MQCIDSPRWGEGRRESEAVGLAPSDILEGSSQFGAQSINRLWYAVPYMYGAWEVREDYWPKVYSIRKLCAQPTQKQLIKRSQP